MASHVVLAGGSGFIGSALEAHFRNAGWRTTVLTRSPSQPHHVKWDAKTAGEWAKVLDGADAIINLTGKSVGVRHTPENKAEIIGSRVNSIAALRDAAAACANPPKVWVQAGGIDAVGEAAAALGDVPARPTPDSFLSQVCAQWEEAFNAAIATLPNTRGVMFRIGPVLGKGSQFLKPMKLLTQLFIGGPAGNGRQHISWVHIDDLVKLARWAIDTPTARGVYNAVAPAAVNNRDFMAALRKVMGRPWAPPAPAFAIALAAPVIGVDTSLVLGGSHGKPERLLREGYQFVHPTLDGALRASV
jgi:uncharacterized protein